MRIERNLQRFFVVFLAASLYAAALTGPAKAGSFLNEGFLISTDTGPDDPSHMGPSIAFNSDRGEYLVVWYNLREVYPDIQAQRVSVGGELVGGPFYIAGGAGATRLFPDVAYNSARQEYLVVWMEEPDGGTPNIRARRIGATGLLIGEPFALGGGPRQTSRGWPAVAWASTSDLYMVVWERLLDGATTHDIEAQILSGTGAAVGANFLVATGTASLDHKWPDIAYNRSRNEHLIVWTQKDLIASSYDVWGRIVTRDGYLLGSDIFLGYQAWSDASVAGTPVAPGFGGYYVVWTKLQPSGDSDIYGTEVGWDGLTTGYDLISAGAAVDSMPTIAYDEAEERFFVVWLREGQSQGSYDVICFPYQAGPFPGVIETCVGASSDPRDPAVASGPGGDFLITWNQWRTGTIHSDVNGRIWDSTTVFRDGFESGNCVAWSQEVPNES